MLTWQSIPGWFTWPDVYQEAIDRAAAGAKFVEIGTFQGRSAICMAAAIKASGKAIAFDTIDNFSRPFGWGNVPPELRPDITRNNFASCEVADFVNLRVMHQLEAASTYADGSLDLVFMDSDHSYAATKAALQAYLPKMKRGGVLAGDDYSTKRFPNVVRAVDEVIPGRVLRGSVFLWTAP